MTYRDAWRRDPWLGIVGVLFFLISILWAAGIEMRFKDSMGHPINTTLAEQIDVYVFSFTPLLYSLLVLFWHYRPMRRGWLSVAAAPIVAYGFWLCWATNFVLIGPACAIVMLGCFLILRDWKYGRRKHLPRAN